MWCCCTRLTLRWSKPLQVLLASDQQRVCCTADASATADGNSDAAQLRAALQMLQEELSGSHAEAATLSKQVEMRATSSGTHQQR